MTGSIWVHGVGTAWEAPRGGFGSGELKLNRERWVESGVCSGVTLPWEGGGGEIALPQEGGEG